MEMKPRYNRPNSNATVVLDIKDIHLLKNIIVPLFTSSSDLVLAPATQKNILKTKKLKDFKD